MLNNINTFLKIIANVLNLQLKTIYLDIKNVLMILLMPMIVLFGVGILIPYHDLLVNSIGMMEILIIFIVFGTLYFPLKTTTIYSNIRLQKGGGEFIILFSTFISCFITMLFVAFIQIFVLAIFSSSGWVFNTNFSIGAIAPDGDIAVDWAKVNWFVVFYFLVMTLIITFLIALIMKGLLKSSRVFYIGALTYFLIDLIWGGVLMSAYTTWDAANNNWPTDVLVKSQKTFTFNTYISMLMPQYYLNQFAFYAFRTGGIYQRTGIVAGGVPVIEGQIVSLHDFNFFSLTPNIQWNLNLLLPPAFIGFYSITLSAGAGLKAVSN